MRIELRSNLVEKVMQIEIRANAVKEIRCTVQSKLNGSFAIPY